MGFAGQMIIVRKGQAVWVRHRNLAQVPGVVRRRSTTRRRRFVVDLEPGFTVDGDGAFVVPRSALRRRRPGDVGARDAAGVDLRTPLPPLDLRRLDEVADPTESKPRSG